MKEELTDISVFHAWVRSLDHGVMVLPKQYPTVHWTLDTGLWILGMRPLRGCRGCCLHTGLGGRPVSGRRAGTAVRHDIAVGFLIQSRSHGWSGLVSSAPKRAAVVVKGVDIHRCCHMRCQGCGCCDSAVWSSHLIHRSSVSSFGKLRDHGRQCMAVKVLEAESYSSKIFVGTEVDAVPEAWVDSERGIVLGNSSPVE